MDFNYSEGENKLQTGAYSIHYKSVLTINTLYVYRFSGASCGRCGIVIDHEQAAMSKNTNQCKLSYSNQGSTGEGGFPNTTVVWLMSRIVNFNHLILSFRYTLVRMSSYITHKGGMNELSLWLWLLDCFLSSAWYVIRRGSLMRPLDKGQFVIPPLHSTCLDVASRSEKSRSGKLGEMVDLHCNFWTCP